MKTGLINRWLQQHGYKKCQIAKELGMTRGAITLAIQGKSTIKRVTQWLRKHGCPEYYLRRGR